MYDIFHKYGFEKIQDSNSLNESVVPEKWEVVATKSVPDYDGFQTEYVWYTNGDKHIFMFGDSDFVEADPDYADWECDSEQEAHDWFNSYTGFETEDEDELLDECSEASSKLLTEAYSNLPDWLTRFLDSKEGSAAKKVMAARGIDLANASYIKGEFPRSNRDPVLKDPTRLAIFRLNDHGYDVIWIVTVNNPLLYKPGSTWEMENAQRLPMKAILEKAVEYGYIDLKDPSSTSTEVRKERALLKQQSGPKRGTGQHPVKKTVYGVDEYGYKDYNNILGTEIEWVTMPGQDKSGYPLDPDKYVKMLDNVGLADHADRLETYFDKLENLRARIISLMNVSPKDVPSTYNPADTFGRNMMSDIGNAVDYLGRAIDAYQKLKNGCGEITSKDSLTDDQKEKRIRDHFKWNVRYFRDYYSNALDAVKKIEAQLS